jgi:hypothetical protein
MYILIGLSCFLNAIAADNDEISTTNNFQIQDGILIWQKVFDTSLSYSELATIVQQSGILTNVIIGDALMTGNLAPLTADIRGAGFTGSGLPMYFRDPFEGFCSIEYQKGRYRITLKNLFQNSMNVATFLVHNEI